MSNLNTSIEELLAHYKPEEVLSAVREAKKKAEEKKYKEKNDQINKAREILGTAFLNYVKTLDLTNDFTETDFKNLKNEFNKTMISFEKEMNLYKPLSKGDIDMIKDFFKYLDRVGLF